MVDKLKQRYRKYSNQKNK